MTPETVCPTCNSVLRYARAARPGWVCPDSWHESGRISAQGAELNLADSPPLEPPTPPSAGELAQILDELWETGWNQAEHQENPQNVPIEHTMSPEKALAAINAYIARRVLEELEAVRADAWDNENSDVANGMAYQRAIDRRIAVIKKESQQ